MSNEVKVIFMGIVLWWRAQDPGPFVIVPDLASAAEQQHLAVITAAQSDFVGEKCPAGFKSDGGRCVFNLNGAGATGGVQLAFTTTTPAAQPFTTATFCDVPKLQSSATPDLALRSEWTPPGGAKNAAWMDAAGGVARGHIEPCSNTVAGDCPRFASWSVPTPSAGHVVMALSNRANGAPPILALLKGGATILVDNSPRLFAGERAMVHHTEPARLTASQDWCLYYQMIRTVSGQPVDCHGAPPIPDCPPAPAPELLKWIHRLRPSHFYYIGTIACSNSQYP
ncbi:MAG TPA: hypothetical protein VEK11_15875 [Thermoanaerobaculia bacterium]|nr:hypothetical protein [Thermoanaerobaculia bacterium]